jgi:hypothetical protein
MISFPQSASHVLHRKGEPIARYNDIARAEKPRREFVLMSLVEEYEGNRKENPGRYEEFDQILTEMFFAIEAEAK